MIEERDLRWWHLWWMIEWQHSQIIIESIKHRIKSLEKQLNANQLMSLLFFQCLLCRFYYLKIRSLDKLWNSCCVKKMPSFLVIFNQFELNFVRIQLWEILLQMQDLLLLSESFLILETSFSLLNEETDWWRKLHQSWTPICTTGRCATLLHCEVEL